jgi:hypothetical protein
LNQEIKTLTCYILLGPIGPYNKGTMTKKTLRTNLIITLRRRRVKYERKR